MAFPAGFQPLCAGFLVFGNAFLEKRYSTTGKVTDWKPHRQNIPAVVWRRMFTVGAVLQRADTFHARLRVSSAEPDINQELYGLPEYLSALNLPG